MPPLASGLVAAAIAFAAVAQILTPGQASMMPADFAERMSDPELDALVDFLLAARPQR